LQNKYFLQRLNRQFFTICAPLASADRLSCMVNSGHFPATVRGITVLPRGFSTLLHS
jgi:hypothetical protein